MPFPREEAELPLLLCCCTEVAMIPPVLGMAWHANARSAGACSSASRMLMHSPFPFPYCSAPHGCSPFPWSTWKCFLPPCLHLPIIITRGKVFVLLGLLPGATSAPPARHDTICTAQGTVRLELGSRFTAAAAFCPCRVAQR